jgi:hypothetical protein
MAHSALLGYCHLDPEKGAVDQLPTFWTNTTSLSNKKDKHAQYQKFFHKLTHTTRCFKHSLSTDLITIIIGYDVIAHVCLAVMPTPT